MKCAPDVNVSCAGLFLLELEAGVVLPKLEGLFNLGVYLGLGEAIRARVLADAPSQLLHPPSASLQSVSFPPPGVGTGTNSVLNR